MHLVTKIHPHMHAHVCIYTHRDIILPHTSSSLLPPFVASSGVFDVSLEVHVTVG